jgi:hypothetical protein
MTLSLFLRFSFVRVIGLMICVCVLVKAPAFVEAASEISDQAISDKIDDELMQDASVIANKIDVATVYGIVTLKGDVANILAKDRAARIAETVKGVRSVINRINVRPAFSRTDADTQADVEAALLHDPSRSRRIVWTRNGDVPSGARAYYRGASPGSGTGKHPDVQLMVERSQT